MTLNGREINNGLIRTDEHCRGCNKCISSCPIFGANIAVQQEGENHIYVDPERCTLCGLCLDRCSHGSRRYEDDTARLLEDLEALRQGRRRRPISVVFAPSFLLNYPEKGPQILGWLKSLGVWHTYSAAFGADIATWGYIQYMERTGRPGLISSACPAVVEAVEKHYPNLIDQLIPVQTPQMCTAIYLRHNLKIETDVAFISPCVAKKAEILRPDNRTYLQYNVTFESLLAATEGLDLSDFEALGSELDYGPGALFPVPGGMEDNLRFYLGDKAPFIYGLEGAESIHKLLSTMNEEDEEGGPSQEVGIFDLLNCQRGCVYGPATQFRDQYLGHITLEIEQRRKGVQALGGTPEERLAALRERFAALDLQHFMTSYYDKTRPVPDIESDELEETFHKMYKFTPEDRSMDCASCGCDSCHQMAQAIVLGLNHLGNCVQYTRTRLGLEHAQALAGQHRLRQLEKEGTVISGEALGTDHLTGLEIRVGFEKKLEEVLEAGRGGYVIGIDLDDFVAVNESYGHHVGNRLLVTVARYLRHEFGSLCSLYRMGGDEFALLAEGIDDHTAQYIVNALLHKGQEAWDVDDLRLFCTASIGVAALDSTATASVVVGRMEAASIAAKNRGKNTFVYYTPELDKDNSTQVQLLHQLRDDVMGGFRGFETHFQPWVTCEGDLVGAEALARWRGADGRYISPGEFIPVAEGAGLINPIGDFVLRQAAEKCLEANLSHPEFTISVNVSAKQFSRPDFFEHTMAILDDVGVDKHNIVLEITESLGFDDIGHQKAVLARLRETGIQIAMDDFGTGYSSLSYLGELPLDLIKIDRAFVRELESDNYSKYLLSSMSDLMHKMGRRVLVEGVETREQPDLCEIFGVDLIQGFLFFRPMPGHQLSQLLRVG